MLARLARVLLVVALFAGWQAALVHPLEHTGANGGLVHLAGDPDKQPEKSVLCDVVAALAACAASAPAALHPLSAVSPASVAGEAFWHLTEAPPFLAQGPPELL